MPAHDDSFDRRHHGNRQGDRLLKGVYTLQRETSMDMTMGMSAAQWRTAFWALLASGLVSVLAGLIILSINWTLATVMLFAGIYLVVRGVLVAFSSPPPGLVSRAWPVTTGIVTALVGVAVLASPRTLVILALFVGVWFIVSGAADIIGGLANREYPGWVLPFIRGLVAVPLGLLILYEPILTLEIAVLVLGIWAVAIGIFELTMAFEARKREHAALAAETGPVRERKIA